MDVPEAQEEEEGGRKRDEKKRRREEETEKTDGEDETGKMERTNGGIKSPIKRRILSDPRRVDASRIGATWDREMVF